MSEKIEPVDVQKLEEIQNRLASSLLKTAAAGGIVAAKDWVQGGWSRSSAAQLLDKIEFGVRKQSDPV